MKGVFNAANSLDAYMIKNLLEVEGIKAYVLGEHLQGGVGILPAINLVKVSVGDEDVATALAIIRDWEKS